MFFSGESGEGKQGHLRQRPPVDLFALGRILVKGMYRQPDPAITNRKSTADGRRTRNIPKVKITKRIIVSLEK